MEVLFMFLPCAFSLIIAAAVWSRANLTFSSNMFAWTMLGEALYIALTGLVSFPYTDPKLIVWSYIGLGFIAPALQVLFATVCWSLYTLRQRFDSTKLIYILIPMSVGVLVLIGFGLVGIDAAADYVQNGRTMPAGLTPGETLIYKIFDFLSFKVYAASIFISVTGSLGFMIYLLYKSDFTMATLMRFLFKGGPIRPFQLLVVLYVLFVACSIFRLSVGREFILHHVKLFDLIFCVQSVVLICTGMVALGFKRPCIYLLHNHRQPTFDDLPVQVLDPRGTENDYADDESDSYRTLNLRDELKLIMREDLCYLQPGMSRYSVSRQLDVSRGGLDRLIHLLHHVTYEEYVMIQRVEYSRRYRELYPNTSVDEVAMACGFPNVQEMNRQTKECSAFFKPIAKR